MFIVFKKKEMQNLNFFIAKDSFFFLSLSHRKRKAGYVLVHIIDKYQINPQYEEK